MALLPNLLQRGLEQLRLNNIYQPPSPTPEIPGMSVQSGLPMQQPEFDVTTRMKELYQPQTGATTNYEQLINQFPQFEQPGGWRRFGAAALGSLTDLGTNFGGTKTGIKGTSVFDEFTGKNKWREDVGSWKEKIEPAYRAANLERQENINARTLAHQTVQGELTQRRNEATVRNQEQQNKIRQQRADIYAWKSRNPNKQLKEMNGMMHVFDPATGKTSNTGVPADAFTEAEKQELDYKQEQAIKRIEATAEGRQDTSETVGWGQPYAVPQPDGTTKYFERNPRTNQTREVDFGKTGGPVQRIGTPGSDRPETAANAKIRHYNSAKEFADENPELGRWITFGAGNTFKIKPPKTGSFGSGPSPIQHQMMTEAIYGPGGAPPEETTQQPTSQFPSSGRGGGRGGGPGTGTRFSPQNPPPSPIPGYKYAPKKGGGWTLVPQ